MCERLFSIQVFALLFLAFVTRRTLSVVSWRVPPNVGSTRRCG